MSNPRTNQASRAHQAGDLDTHFAGAGYLIDVARTFAPDPTLSADQKFYATGFGGVLGTTASTISRYTADGALDTDTTGSGRATWQWPLPSVDEAKRAVLDVQGLIFGKNDAGVDTITCVGVTWETVSARASSFNYFPAAIRLEASGEPDKSFGEGGVKIYPFVQDPIENPAWDRRSPAYRSYRATRQAQGGFLFSCPLIAGISKKAMYVVVKVNSDGSPDKSYGDDGVLVISPPAGVDAPTWTDYGIDNAGDMTLVGAEHGYGNGVLSRYGSDGKLDGGYGTGGILVYSVATVDSYITQIHVSPDDGSTTLLLSLGEPRQCAAVARLLKDGSSDPDFNQGMPVVLTDVVVPLANLAVDVKGRTVVAGRSVIDPTVLRVIRLTSAGQFDASFGANGSQGYPTLLGVDGMAIQNGVDILLRTNDTDEVDINTAELVRIFGEDMA
ncbi:MULTISPECIES: hypothetical protein [unclassified Pseudomonas]|uniref:hypothetical protein n=1 Tax=unclassified Pseudomonas TaxID=196821 RepID=UPI00178518E2|nr:MULTISPECIES: hypothetical protein [unclassified Pseudomonas]MBD8597565.1 hypothetical protein [Pseudomonas sp. CFBP 8772]